MTLLAAIPRDSGTPCAGVLIAATCSPYTSDVEVPVQSYGVIAVYRSFRL